MNRFAGELGTFHNFRLEISTKIPFALRLKPGSPQPKSSAIRRITLGRFAAGAAFADDRKAERLNPKKCLRSMFPLHDSMVAVIPSNVVLVSYALAIIAASVEVPDG